MVEIAVQSLGDLPQNLAAACREVEGKVMLDETLLKTQADLDAVLEAKRKEVNDHNATKAGLDKWRKLGYDSPEEIADLIADLKNRSGNSSDLTEKLAALQREKRDIIKERDAFKSELEGIKPLFEQQKKAITDAKIQELMEAETAKLKGVDVPKLNRSLKRDVALGLISLDESGEALIVKTGGEFAKYAMEQAQDFGFLLHNIPGGSNPGADNLPRSLPAQQGKQLPGQVSYLDAELEQQLSQ